MNYLSLNPPCPIYGCQLGILGRFLKKLGEALSHPGGDRFTGSDNAINNKVPTFFFFLLNNCQKNGGEIAH